MSNNKAWTEKWLKAQQKFVESWTDMGNEVRESDTNEQSKLWANGMEMWRKAYPYPNPTQPEADQVINKCMEVGKGYFAMAEQIGKQVSSGGKPEDVTQLWIEQLKTTLQQQSNQWSPMQHQPNNDFMSQWMGPSAGWQKIAAAMMPMQMSSSNHANWGMGEEFEQPNQFLSIPGIGPFRESQEKQQAGIKLAMEYQQASHLFNQSSLRVSIESLQSFQKLRTDLNDGKDSQAPSTLRGIYDLWIEVSEASYADFAMSEEYQTLYGDMVNRLMKLKKHHSEMLDDTMASMNLPTRKEIDTMQERLQQTRRDNKALRRELKEIRAMLAVKKPSVKRPTVKKATVKKSAPIKKKSAKPSTRTKKGA